MAFFRVTPEQAAELASAHALAAGVPRTGATLLGDAARDDALGMPDSAAALRALAHLTRALPAT